MLSRCFLRNKTEDLHQSRWEILINKKTARLSTIQKTSLASLQYLRNVSQIRSIGFPYSLTSSTSSKKFDYQRREFPRPSKTLHLYNWLLQLLPHNPIWHNDIVWKMSFFGNWGPFSSKPLKLVYPIFITGWYF